MSASELKKATTTYYDVVATIDGEQEQLFGSYDKADCTSEVEAEKFLS